MAPNIRTGLAVILFRDNSQTANRRSSPCTTKASAKKKLPIKRKMIGWANVARTSLADPNPMAIHNAAPTSEVTAKGMASVAQLTTTHTRMAESTCAEGGRLENGLRYTRSANTGAAYRPTRCLIPQTCRFADFMPMRLRDPVSG